MQELADMGKINYVCTACGKGFTTGNSARRHVRTVEKGGGLAVSEASYRAGLAAGVFVPALPGRPPKFENVNRSRSKPPVVLDHDEFFRGFWRRAGELYCEEIFKDPIKRQQVDNQIQLQRILRMKELMHEEQAEREQNLATNSAAEAASTFYEVFKTWYKW